MSDNWQSFARQLSEKGYQVITADLRNHGLSPHDDVHDYPSMAADVAELIADLNLHQPVVIGHSMGGKMTLSLINSFPHLVSKAVVIDIAPYQYPVHHRRLARPDIHRRPPLASTRVPRGHHADAPRTRRPSVTKTHGRH
jgi:pimeloyl-ACP methyl ester carboxylesterase